MLQPRMRIFLLYTGCLLEAVHDVSKNPGSDKADFSRNTAIRESGLSAAIRCVIILRLLCGLSGHCFLTSEWPLFYHGHRCEPREKRTRALSRKTPRAKVRRMHAPPASVGKDLHQALRSGLAANAMGRQRIRPVTARAMIGRARDRRRGRLLMCLSPYQGHFDSRLKTIPVLALQ